MEHFTPNEYCEFAAGKMGISPGELEELAKKKQRDYADLLSFSGAINVIATQRGVKLREEEVPKLLTGAPVNSKVSGVMRFHYNSQLRNYKNERGEGSVLNAFGAGQVPVSLVLWNYDASKFTKMELRKNEFILIKNAVVKREANPAKGESMEISALFATTITKPAAANETWETAARAPGNNVDFTKLANSASKICDVECTVLQVGDVREFQKQVGTGKMCRAVVEQGGKQVNLVAWGSASEAMQGITAPCKVAMENVTVKENKFSGLELQTTDTFRLTHLSDASHIFPLVEISKLKNGETSRIAAVPSELEVKVIHKCPKCNLTIKQGKCSACNVDSRELLIAEVKLTEANNPAGKTIKCNFFDRQALELLGVKSIAQDTVEAVTALKKLPNQVELLVVPKENGYMNEQTTNCKKIVKITR